MKIKLKLWAEKNFNPAPHRNTIVNWLKDGRISPAPEFIGRSYFVDENARYVGASRTAPPRPDRMRLSERIDHGTTKKQG